MTRVTLTRIAPGHYEARDLYLLRNGNGPRVALVLDLRQCPDLPVPDDHRWQLTDARWSDTFPTLTQLRRSLAMRYEQRRTRA